MINPEKTAESLVKDEEVEGAIVILVTKDGLRMGTWGIAPNKVRDVLYAGDSLSQIVIY